MKYLVTFLLLTNIAMAKPSSKKPHLREFIDKVSKLTGVQYIIPSRIKGDVEFTKNFKLTKKNADLTLSYILNSNGYTRIDHEENVFKIVESRDVRYNPVSVSQASKAKAPSFADNYDYKMMEYSMSTQGVSTEVTRSLRPFMSRYGRVIDVRYANKLFIQDTAKNLYRLYGLIKSMDVKPQRDNWEEELQFERTIRLEKAKNCGNKKD